MVFYHKSAVTLAVDPALLHSVFVICFVYIMENQLKAECEVKSEEFQNEDEDTPVRDEPAGTPEPASAGIATAATGWNSDIDEQQTPRTPVPPSPPAISQIRIKKRSPSSDMELSPLRLSPLDSLLMNAGTSTELQPKNNQLMDQQMKTESTTIFKNEQRRELPLGFLDAFSEADFEVPSEQSHRDEMEYMNLGEPSNEDENEKIQKDLEALGIVKKELMEKLNSSGKKKKKHKKKHKNNPEEVRRKRHRSKSPSPAHRKEPRVEERLQHNDILPDVKPSSVELGFVPVQDCETQVKVVNIKKLLPNAEVPAQASAPPLTIREKRRLAVERVKTVLNLMKLKASKVQETEFLVVDTIRQLPRDTSFMSCAIFENPSPLCNNYNVRYKFNSTSASNINITKWGLEAMPLVTSELLRLTGIDVTRLMQLKQNSKMPLQKLRLKEQAERAANQAVDESVSTGLYSSVSTQTDGRIGQYTRDIGIQAMPSSSSQQQGIFWLDSRFCETDVSQQHANVMLALKELCATAPRSTYWADELFKALRPALAIKRNELKTSSSY